MKMRESEDAVYENLKKAARELQRAVWLMYIAAALQLISLMASIR